MRPAASAGHRAAGSSGAGETAGATPGRRRAEPASVRNRAGRQLGGRYTLLSLIATGGMGEVWKARDQQMGVLVAAKVLRPELHGEEISLSRLRLEARNAIKAKHPNIAAVFDSGEDGKQGWLVMELVDGRPLTDFIGQGSKLTAGELIPIMIQTAYALDAAARAGVVHRDIKPANIMIRPDGKVKLTDFGVSLANNQANLTAAGMVMGTAQYLAPELALGNSATTLGDLYALGVIAYEALVGQRPYTGKNQVDIAFAHVNEDIPALPDDVPAPLAALVTQMLAKQPADRPQTGAALARELFDIAAGLGVSTQPVPLRAVRDSVAEAAPEAGQPSGAAVEIATGSEPVAVDPAGAERQFIGDAAEPAGASGGLAGADPAEELAATRPSVRRGRHSAGTGAVEAEPAQRPGSPAISPAVPPRPRTPTGMPPVVPPASARTASPAWRPVQAKVPPTDLAATASPTATSVDPGSDGGPTGDAASVGADSAGAGIQLDKGFLIIGALVVLTLILIVIAMLTGDDAHAVTSAARACAQPIVQEGESWLTPILDV